MTHQDLRQKYPRFVYESFSHRLKDGKLFCEFNYSIPPDHRFTHAVVYESLGSSSIPENLIFHLGLAEMANYWKLTCSPVIEVAAGALTPDQIKFWHKLFINGFGQYFYENQIDFTSSDFLIIKMGGTSRVQASADSIAAGTPAESQGSMRETQTHSPNALQAPNSHDRILIPIGGGKDSVVTLELLKKDFAVTPIIVYPTTPASLKISKLAGFLRPVIARRRFDPLLFQLNKQGYLNGHVPYSAILAFIFLLAASADNIPYIAVSNERSSDEANIEYLDRQINHQYSKTLEFEKDLNQYLKSLTQISYFSFLRPLYDLQITKLFSRYPQFFPIFKSCNVGQKTNSWCGRCPKCLSVALSLIPWVREDQVVKIMSTNPATDPANSELLSRMTDSRKVKPFECITTIEEAQVCLEFIQEGATSRVKEFLSRWGPSPMPPQFLNILKNAYSHS